LTDPEELFYAGVAYRENKDFRQAAELFKRVIQNVPDRTWQGRAQYELGHVYYDSREYRTAEHAFERAYRIYQVPKALYDLARCAVRRGEDMQAAKLFLDFAAKYPDVNGAADAFWHAAMAYERQGQWRTARQVYIDLAKTFPKSTYADQAAWRAGFALYQLKHYESAVQAFLQLAQQTEEEVMRDQGYYWAGKCYQKLGKEEEAQKWIGRAAKGFPTSYYSARARAVLNIQEDIYPATPEHVPISAGQVYEPSIYMKKGDVLASLGLYQLAEDEYDRVLRVPGNNLFVLDDLLQRYERIRSMNKALQVSGQIVMAQRRQGQPMTLSSFRRLYPTYYWDEITRTAQEMDLDPNLMLAIMRQESAFNHVAESPVGARGLMQVMPTTGKDMARKVNMKDFSPEDLYDPQISIRLGGQHLADHLKSFDKGDGRRLGLALSAYNAGLNAARRWSRHLSKEDVDEFVETIPYKETRNYVKLVYRNYQVYSYLQHDADQRVQNQVH
jgi:soluble lytic murein transglycosylase